MTLTNCKIGKILLFAIPKYKTQRRNWLTKHIFASNLTRCTFIYTRLMHNLESEKKSEQKPSFIGANRHFRCSPT